MVDLDPGSAQRLHWLLTNVEGESIQAIEPKGKSGKFYLKEGRLFPIPSLDVKFRRVKNLLAESANGPTNTVRKWPKTGE